MLTVQAQLGNQMFQYAAARTAAERRGWSLAWREHISPGDFLRRRLGRRTYTHQVMLPVFFALDGDGRLRNAWRNALWHLRHGRSHHEYRSTYRELAPECWAPEFDPDFGKLPRGSEIQAWLQSPLYFEENRAHVCRWFRLRQTYARRLDQLERSFPAPREERCCIHIRRTDFATQTSGWGDAKTGWILPLDYYRRAVATLPAGLFFVVVSDDPDWAEAHLDFLARRFISRGEAAAVDMHLHTRCRFNVIANSTFSWWGAWLNDPADREVICPNYFNGWRHRVWSPPAIRVDDWKYIDAQA